jgi:hypothetical protein
MIEPMIDVDAVPAARGPTEFSVDTPSRRLKERLVADVPTHPLVRLYRWGAVLCGVQVGMAAMSLAAPLLSPELAQQVSRLDAVVGLSMPALFFIVLGCVAVTAVAGRQLSVSRDQLSSRWPRERAGQQRLAAEGPGVGVRSRRLR